MTERRRCSSAPVPTLQRLTRRERRDDDLAALVPAAARGDQRAWQMLVARYAATVRHVARRHGLRAVEQEDVAQQTWMRLVEHIDRVREPLALGGWLATTARHE